MLKAKNKKATVTNQTYIRRSKDIQVVFWTSYIRSIYILCKGGKRRKNDVFEYLNIYLPVGIL